MRTLQQELDLTYAHVALFISKRGMMAPNLKEIKVSISHAFLETHRRELKLSYTEAEEHVLGKMILEGYLVLQVAYGTYYINSEANINKRIVEALTQDKPGKETS